MYQVRCAGTNSSVSGHTGTCFGTSHRGTGTYENAEKGYEMGTGTVVCSACCASNVRYSYRFGAVEEAARLQ
eukprot:scaffold175569_cov19-Prasinocladus_malaysianus.AAC.1